MTIREVVAVAGVGIGSVHRTAGRRGLSLSSGPADRASPGAGGLGPGGVAPWCPLHRLTY